MTTVRPAECLTSFVEHDGERYSLCLVKHHWDDEGAATIEHLTRDDNSKGEPRATMFLSHGTWRTKADESGEYCLSLEFSELDDLEPGAVNALLAALDLSVWGMDRVEVYS